MERQPTLVKPLGEVSNSEMPRQFSAPAMFRRSHVSVQLMRRPSAREWITCTNGRRDPRLHEEARELFEREKSRLVEKPGTTTNTSTTASTTNGSSQRSSLSQDMVTWSERGGGGGVGAGGGGGGGGGGMQQTQYMRRLVDLRDELLNQEETALARAVDRLRLHSLNNKDVAKYRLKLKDTGGESPRVGMTSGQMPCASRPMLTTLEKFRQMRPQRQPRPTLFPLQGKQLIESSLTNGGSSQNGTEHSLKNEASAPQRGVEDTVKLNLQRLVHPSSSSIPNIGRKALRRHEALEPRAQQLQHVHHKTPRPSRPRQVPAAPFRLQLQGHQEGGQGGEDNSAEGSERRADHLREDSTSSSSSAASSPRTPPLPPAYKMGTMIDGDRLDMEKLNQYYYVYCLPDEEGVEEDHTTPVSRLPPARGGRLHPDGAKPRRTHSERPKNSEKPDVRRPYSDRAGLGGVSASVSGDDTRRSSPTHKRTVGMLTGPDRISLPVIRASEDSFSPARHGHKGKLQAFVTEAAGVSSSVEIVPSTGRRKKHIVIDMPHILFSSATPDVTREPTLAEVEAHADHPPGALNKALEQTELRPKGVETLPLPES